MTANSNDSPQGRLSSDRNENILQDLDGPEQLSDANVQPETPDPPLDLTVEFIAGGKLNSTLADPKQATTSTDKSTPDSPAEAVAAKPRMADSSVRFSVPGYEILRELGRGGMGVVYQARQRGLNRLVALKMILSGAHAGPQERDRFRREAEAVAQLQHPNIVQIFEVGEADGRPYLAFEYVEGGSLGSYLAGQPWPALQSAEFVEILARAVQFAHERGIVHRDLKPGNILISGFPFRSSKGESAKLASETIKVTDFGLAKRFQRDSDNAVTEDYNPSDEKGHTRTGAVMGTPSYIAPEQAAGRNKDVGPAADVYALCAILYELLTGRPPFRGETALDTVLQVMSEDPVPPRRLQPRIPRDLETICLKGLQKAPARRYASSGALADDLNRFLNHKPIEARPVGYWDRGIKWAKRRPAAATLGVTSVLTLVTLLSLSISFNFRLREAADAKENEARIAREERERADIARADAQYQATIAKANAKNASDREQRALLAEKHSKEANEAASKQLEISRRGEYALTLNQVMALGERDPQGASRLLLNPDRCPPRLRDFTWHMLRRMYLIEEEQVQGHNGPVGCLAYSTDGHLLASASWDGTVRIWDMRTLQTRAVLLGHRGVVRSVAFAPDNRNLVTTGNDGTIRLWELPATWTDPAPADAPSLILKSWEVLTVEREAFRTAIFSADGKFLIAGSEKGNIFIWDAPLLPRRPLAMLAGGAMLLTIHTPEGGHPPEMGTAIPVAVKFSKPRVRPSHRADISALIWTQRGLLSASWDKTVHLWNLKDNTPDEVLLTHRQPIFAMASSPEHSILAIVGDSRDEPSILLWDTLQRKNVGVLRGHTKTVSAVSFDPEGKWLASAGHDGTVRIWDPLTGQERYLLRGHASDVRSVAFSKGRWAIASGGEHSVRLWSLAGQREEKLDIEPNPPLRGIAISADRRWMVQVDKDGHTGVWLVHYDPHGKLNRELAYTLKGNLGPNIILSISPDGSYVAAASMIQEDWVVRIWTLPAFQKGKHPVEIKESRSWKAPGRIHTLAIHGHLLATAGAGGLQIWDLAARQMIKQLVPAIGEREVLSAVFSPDGKRLFSAVGKRVQIWNLPDGTEIGQIETFLVHSKSREGIQMLAVNENQEGRMTLATVDELGMVCLWDVAPQPAMKNSSDPSGEAILKQRCALSGHMEAVTSLSFTPDGNSLATTSEDRTVRLWDTVSGQERATLTGHTDAVTVCRFFGDGTAMMTVGREGHLRIWHTR